MIFNNNLLRIKPIPVISLLVICLLISICGNNYLQAQERQGMFPPPYTATIEVSKPSLEYDSGYLSYYYYIDQKEVTMSFAFSDVYFHSEGGYQFGDVWGDFHGELIYYNSHNFFVTGVINLYNSVNPSGYSHEFTEYLYPGLTSKSTLGENATGYPSHIWGRWRVVENMPPSGGGQEIPYSGNIVDPGTSSGGEDSGTIVAPPEGGDGIYIVPPDLPPYSPTDGIPDDALPVATSVAALITLLSALSIASAGGTTPVELLNELKEFFTPNREEAPNLPQTLPADGRDPQEILSDPRLHDQVTDVNGKQWVYYRRPGDEAGDGWTSLDEYNQTLSQEKQGRLWNGREWMTREESENAKQLEDTFKKGNLEADRQFREEIAREKAERKRQMDAEIARRAYIEELKSRQEDLEFQAKLDQNAIQFSAKEGLKDTSREIFTGQTKVLDPETGQYVYTTSYKATGLRLFTGLLTGGQSEYLFNTADASYRVSDRLESGESLIEAIANVANEMAGEELTGQGMMKAGGALVRGTKALIKNPPSLLKQSEQLTDALKSKKADLEDVLKIKDPAEKAEAIKKLYKKGGMADLGELERAGQISAKQAKEMNQVITKEVNEAVNEATTKTMKDLRVAGKDGVNVKVEGVKVKEVMVGDSGSSARPGSGRSIVTDHDRTTYVSFEKDSLEAYARKNGLSVQEAQSRLNKTFADQQQANLDNALKNRGLDPSDVDQKIYSGIGKGAGQADDYAEGITATRQATQGKTTVFRTDGKEIKTPYTSSGEAMTDQIALDRQAGQQGDLTDMAKIGGNKAERLVEAKALAEKQGAALSNINNAQKAAKALERLDKAAALAGTTRPSPELMGVAKELTSGDLQGALGRLGADGQKDFLNAVKGCSGIADEIMKK